MSWPTPQDFNEAVQNPRMAFTDPDLSSGQPELTPLGLPRPISGGFACVYKIQSGARLWAARCFLREVADQQRRYEAISKHLESARLGYAVPFSYLPTGIKVNGKSYPLLKMEWIQGESLSSFIGRSIGYPSTLLSLAKAWLQMVDDLQAANISHGDLQHGNILVVGDGLRLIDYDGMFVPSLAGNTSRECGHRNYQHPARTEFDYGLYLDNFSAWVIYLSLIALAEHPELWRNHRGGDECLLFRKEDFLHPESSALLSELNRSSNIQLRSLAQLFRSLLNLSPQDIPSLSGNHPTITAGAVPRTATQAASSWLDDHVNHTSAAPQQAYKTSEPAEAATGKLDLAWIFEPQDDPVPVEPVRFMGSMKAPRTLLLVSCLLTASACLFIGLRAIDLVVVVSGTISLNLLFCYLRYKADLSVTEFSSFKQGVDNLLNQVRDQKVILDNLSAERSQVSKRVLEVEKEVAAGKTKAQVTLQANLDQAQATYNLDLQRLDERRSEILRIETNELNEAQRNLGYQVAGIDRDLILLAQKETAEKDQSIKALRDIHVLAFLRKHLISGARIAGIGPTFTMRLSQAGITSAADISTSAFRVEGIGGARYSALLNWRTQLESLAAKSAPSHLPGPEAANIELKFANERQALEARKSRLQAQLSAQVAAIRLKATNARQTLPHEEQGAKVRNTQKQSLMRQSHAAQLVALEQRAVEAKRQAAPTLNELSEKIRCAQKQLFTLQWQSAKQERAAQWFASLSFSDYLKVVIGL